MDRYFSTVKRKSADKSCNGDDDTLPKPKSIKYDNAYLSLGFTVNVVGEEERPIGVLCLKTLAADSMRPNKLKRHLKTLHPSHVNKPPDFFKRRLDECRQQVNHFDTASSVSSKAQLASYRVTYRIAKCKKPHTRAEELILPAAIDMVSIMIDDASADKLKAVPLSIDTVARCICDISNDLEDQLVEKLKADRLTSG